MLALLIAAAAAAASPSPIDPARIKADVRTLSSDAFAGRGPGEAGEARTVEFLSRSMAEIGLEPAGDRGGWTHAVPLVRFDRLPGATMTLRAGPRSWPLAMGRDVALTLRNDGATAIADAPLVFGGWGVVDAAKGWDAYAGVELKGKVVVLLANDPDFEAGRDLGFGGRALNIAGRSGTKVGAALKAGALGVVFIHEEAAFSWPFEQAGSGDALPGFGFAPLATTPLAFSAILRGDLGEALLAEGGLTLAAAKRLARDPAFRAVPLANARVSVAGTVRATALTSSNVIGKITGAERPDEYVLYGAHWDANGHNGPDPSGDAIRNGAIDNAVGTAELLEVARAFKAGPRPARTVIFAAWTAEEKGLLGAEHYAANPPVPLARMAAVINLDPHVALPASRNLELIGPGQTDLETLLANAAREAGQRVDAEPAPEAGWYFRSDHFPFAQRGVPALAFRAGRDLVEGGSALGGRIVADYNRRCYHQPCDAFDPAWTFAGTAQEAAAAYRVGAAVANSSAWPAWLPGAPYAAIRAASAAERR